ncbi:hypothetical protein CAPSP0001_2418 [Capnocytophaga sputigena ATCC 33612]|nr:hypothetical protein CAPSP0001_2418 [Capnocytophaga sputigena ATCC 33612]DAI47765.1 MAG TPA: hypothetical protein [Caudoviricetes sp.]DAJ64159.1 MAG TPA: hypothetical protein [Caudoviricetes sp.]DAN65375.1 MAG TPA: hypothetical protein [Caudoviricetes sp.]
MSSASACFLFPISWGLQKYNYFLKHQKNTTSAARTEH